MLSEHQESDDRLDDDELNEELDDNPFLNVLGESEDQTGEDDIPDDEDEAEEGDVSIEVLKERIRTKNRMLKQSRKAIARIQAEKQGLMKDSSNQQPALTPELIAALRGDQRSASDEGEDETTRLTELFNSDPSNIVKIMLEREAKLESKLANVLQLRDQHFRKQMKPKVSKEIASAVEALKGHPEYKGFSDEQLETVAKHLVPVVKTGGRPPAGVSGSRGGGAGGSGKQSLLDKYSDELAQMGYDS